VTAIRLPSIAESGCDLHHFVPGHGRFDEGPHARLVAHTSGRAHRVGCGSSDIELLPELARQFDEPVADSAIVADVPGLENDKTLTPQWRSAGTEGTSCSPVTPLQLAPARGAHAAVYTRTAPKGSGVFGAATAHRIRGRNHLIGFGGNLAWSIAHIICISTRACDVA